MVGLSASRDPWGALTEDGGECRDQRAAFFMICITKEERVLTTCLASLCALLATTDPACVVALVSLWVYRAVHDVLALNGVLAILAPEWPPLPRSHPYASLRNRSYSFSKLEAFRLQQYGRVASFDADVAFLRNASGLLEFEPFAASRIPRGKDPARFINNGVMVLRPSLLLYKELVDTWRSGRHGLHYSDRENGDQDVVIELCILRGLCGPVSDLDACVYNHGSWLPGPLGRECDPEAVVARHNFRAAREVDLASDLQTAMYRGTCRARAGRGPRPEECWDERNGFTRSRCCTPVSRWEPWGDLRCWGNGLTYERCCLGLDDAKRLRSQLLEVGEAWYGLSSLPDRPAEDLLAARCWRAYDLAGLTFSALSGGSTTGPVEEWPSEAMLEHGRRCRAMRAPHLREEGAIFLLFRFAIEDYLARWAPVHALVGDVHRRYLSLPEIHEHFGRLSACVPTVCCRREPMNVGSSITGLHKVLWSFYVEVGFHLRLSDLPPPEQRDFWGIEVVNPTSPGERLPCHR